MGRALGRANRGIAPAEQARLDGLACAALGIDLAGQATIRDWLEQKDDRRKR